MPVILGRGGVWAEEKELTQKAQGRSHRGHGEEKDGTEKDGTEKAEKRKERV